MWIRKSQKRILIEDQIKKYKLTTPLLIFIVTTLSLYVLFFAEKTRGFYIGPFVSKNDNALPYYLIIISISLFFSISVGWLRIKKNNTTFDDEEEKSGICFKCFEPQSLKDKSICQCGGRLELFKNVEWLGPKEENIYKDTPLQFEESKISEIKKPILFKILNFLTNSSNS